LYHPEFCMSRRSVVRLEKNFLWVGRLLYNRKNFYDLERLLCDGETSMIRKAFVRWKNFYDLERLLCDGKNSYD